MCIKLKKAAKNVSDVPMDAPVQKSNKAPVPAVAVINKNKTEM